MLKYVALSLVFVAATNSFALAQFSGGSATSGGTQSYGSFGNRTLGGSTTSARTNTGSLSSSSSSTGGTAGAGGTPSGLGATANGQSNVGGQVTGSERFLKQNRNGAFVGADSGDTTNVYSQQDSNQGMNNLFGQQGLFSQLNRMSQQNLRNQNQGPGKKPLRIPIRAEIELPREISPLAVSALVTTRMQHLPAMAKFGSIQVAMQGRTAVLAGRVPTERAKRLAEGVVMLEPGVSDVQNDLIVDPAASTVELLPAPKPN